MDISNAQRARVLVHALPYIQDYSGKIVVVKYGGNAMVSEHLKDSVIRDICLLQLIGVKVVLVHGGGPEITETLGKMGKKSAFVDGVRVTDEEAVGVALMVLRGDGVQPAHAFDFQAIDYTAAEMTRASHDFDLEPADATIVSVDYMQSGIGSNSCGPELLPQYRLDAPEFRFAVTLRPQSA